MEDEELDGAGEEFVSLEEIRTNRLGEAGKCYALLSLILSDLFAFCTSFAASNVFYRCLSCQGQGNQFHFIFISSKIRSGSPSVVADFQGASHFTSS